MLNAWAKSSTKKSNSYSMELSPKDRVRANELGDASTPGTSRTAETRTFLNAGKGDAGDAFTTTRRRAIGDGREKPRNGRLRQPGVRKDDLDVIERHDGCRTPGHLRDSTGLVTVVEFDPVAHVERALQLQREARHEVTECVLHRECDDGRQERGCREDRARLDVDRSEGEQRDEDVDDARREISEDARSRTRRAAFGDDVNEQHNQASADRSEQEEGHREDEKTLRPAAGHGQCARQRAEQRQGEQHGALSRAGAPS